MTGEPEIREYYVDEAGDLTLFNKKGRIIIGNPGVSQFFMVGVAQISDSDQLGQKLESLRKNILKDPVYKNVPSMQLEANKTAVAFHAKNDLAEIRLKVFEILKNSDTKIYVAIRNKKNLAHSAQRKYQETGEKLNQNKIYDNLVTRTFKNLLHKADANQIVFARRGNKPRETALENAIDKARKNFEKKWDRISLSDITIKSAYPSKYWGLQVVDYYLWALQRLYERKEDEFFNPIAHQYRLIMDLDDRRKKRYGEYYCDSNPLCLKRIDFYRG